MNPMLEDLALALKQARTGKALSQRAAGELSGVHQYQVSKIEKGRVDPRLSTLLQLSRAVGLELRLVPRQALPAVDGLLRSLAGPAAAALDESGESPAAYRLDDD